MNIQMLLADATSTINNGVTQACGNSCNTGTTLGGVFAGVANTLVFLVGAVSVIMIIVGGLQYVLANGDSKRTETAKNTILYSIIGIVVAISAFAIVNFVVTQIK